MKLKSRDYLTEIYFSVEISWCPLELLIAEMYISYTVVHVEQKDVLIL